MNKFIRIKQTTYDELVKDSTYEDTMDSIIQRLLKYSNLYKEDTKDDMQKEKMING